MIEKQLTNWQSGDFDLTALCESGYKLSLRIHTEDGADSRYDLNISEVQNLMQCLDAALKKFNKYVEENNQHGD